MMRVVLALANDEGLVASLRAAMAESDLLLHVRSTDEGLRKLISFQADVAIIDDTSELGRRALLQIHEAAPEMPIIVLAARGDDETKAGFHMAGARACLNKPFACQDLESALDQLCSEEKEVALSTTYHAEPMMAPDTLKQHQTAMRWLSRTSSYMKNPERLAQGLLDTLVDVFDAVRCTVLLERNGAVGVAASAGIPEDVASGVRLEYASGLMRYFEERASLIDRDSARTEQRAAKELQVLGARLGAPLLAHGRACGAILVGDKASGDGYTVEERELLGMIARCASISLENARYYQSVAQEQNRLDTVLGSITTGVVVVDGQRRISMVNSSAEQILRVRAQDVIGRSVQKLGSAFADVVLRTMKDGHARLRQAVRDAAINAKLGLSVTPLSDSGAVIVFSQLPEEAEQDEDIVYSPFWEYLSARVAQEVKNPMVAINTFAQLLPRKYDSEDFREAFSEVVQKEIARINGVVDTLNEFAQRPHLMLQLADLNDTIRGILQSFEGELQNRRIELEADWDPASPAAKLDPIYFSQAVHNVLQNSIDAMPEGGRLRIRTRKVDDGCEVTISDTGPGVSNQDAQNIFMPFYSTKEKGMGLGLTVAVRILRQHEGDLTLTAGEDGGSVFALRMPPAGEIHADHSGN